MKLSENERAAASAFLLEAERFRVFITTGAGALDVATRVETLVVHLTCLYSLAVVLPQVEPAIEYSLYVVPESPRLSNWVGVNERFYREVFDPFPADAVDQPVVGDIDDDLLDILRNLDEGNSAWTEGDEQMALWHWRHTFQTHWGNHCVDALRALHRLITRSRAE